MKKIVVFLMMILSNVSQSYGVLKVNVTQGKVAPTPIAVTPIFLDSYGVDELAYKMAQVIEANLDRCGLFKTIDQKAFVQGGESLRKGPRFEDWKLIKARLLTIAALHLEQGRLTLTLKLYDVLTAQEIGTFSCTDAPQNWRKISHKISDSIYKAITGEAGYFSTKIVYVSETGSRHNLVKKLSIIDQDGANPKALTDGTQDIQLPVFSPTSQVIAYAAYKYQRGEKAKIYLMNLETGQTQIFVDQSKMEGVAFSPRFSSDGQRLIFSIARGGTTSIYAKEISSGTMQRLTQHIGHIDTSPCYSPDGGKIVFQSDLGSTGTRSQIYTMNADGSNIVRISKGKGSYIDPIWSPRGDLIAFIKVDRGNFYLGVMKPDGSNERLILKDYQVELPSWSPNGRVLIYKKQGRVDSKGNVVKRVYSIDLTGFNNQEIRTPTNAEMPSWSPLIH
jgi:TolB protein